MQIPASRGVAIVAVVACSACADPTDPGAAACSRRAPLVLEVGEVAEPPELVGGTLCIESADAAEYVVVATVTPAGQAVEVDVLGSGFIAGSPDLTDGPASSPARATEGTMGMPRAGDIGLRHAELDELTPRIGPRLAGEISPVRAARAAHVPSVGALAEYATAVACGVDPAVRQGRVVAVTAHAVVLIDVDAPTPGFSDIELQAFGDFFDASVYPTLTDAFGEPSDIDANGRVVVFFTPASNALGGVGTGSVVGGFFWAGHLFPAAGGSGSRLGPCAASAEAEILYMSVPDPGGLEGAPISAAGLETHAVLGHEMQHLLSASRRLHVTGASELEETWLNEGLSHIAEELLFYQATGLAPGGNLGGDDLVQLGVVSEFNRFAYGNVGRFNVFLQGPHFHSLLGGDGIETRGAAWAYLRYVLDRSADPRRVLRQLASSTATGVENLAAAVAHDPVEMMAEWAVSLVADDLPSAAPDPRYQQSSWDLKSIIADIRADHRYPVAIIGVPPDQGVRFSLRTGGAGFGSFRLEAGGRASVRVELVQPGASVRAFLVRVR